MYLNTFHFMAISSLQIRQPLHSHGDSFELATNSVFMLLLISLKFTTTGVELHVPLQQNLL